MNNRTPIVFFRHDVSERENYECKMELNERQIHSYLKKDSKVHKKQNWHNPYISRLATGPQDKSTNSWARHNFALKFTLPVMNF